MFVTCRCGFLFWRCHKRCDFSFETFPGSLRTSGRSGANPWTCPFHSATANQSPANWYWPSDPEALRWPRDITWIHIRFPAWFCWTDTLRRMSASRTWLTDTLLVERGQLQCKIVIRAAAIRLFLWKCLFLETKLNPLIISDKLTSDASVRYFQVWLQLKTRLCFLHVIVWNLQREQQSFWSATFLSCLCWQKVICTFVQKPNKLQVLPA